ncbi:fimbrial protein [Alcaligenes endophyticus]|uniref:Type 1 fimbrial protein n=1 Tax=Alcaligenes endophyticus TaxID=1929088 RepID=A0ABT8EFI1_9BURK|nr:fimbrial protein [Alcaligenes endophyticus]MCX5590294.1 fimbrial protein [Alcaligenes endophyticus]MDN4120042.1 type 1 fimbrial protein [Alcaligenes endophyticus]
MIKKLSISLGCYLLLSSSIGIASNVTQLTITGDVLAPTCGNIVVNSGNAVDFGSINSRELKEIGFHRPVRFFITFENCDSNVKQKVAMAFAATTLPGSADEHIALDVTPSSASGIGISLKDPLNNDIKFNNNMGLAPEYMLNDGQVNLEFTAYLVPVNSGWVGIQPGTINARATFSVEYR